VKRQYIKYYSLVFHVQSIELFQTAQQNISFHIRNVVGEGEVKEH